jgi:hypothetical protein
MGDGEPDEEEEYEGKHDEPHGEVEEVKEDLLPVTPEGPGTERLDLKRGRPKEEKWSYVIALLIPIIIFIIVLVNARTRYNLPLTLCLLFTIFSVNRA